MGQLVEVRGLGVAVGGRWLFRGVDMNLGAGEMAWISGPSGGGKSTLLKTMVRLNEPDEGGVWLLGSPAWQWPAPRLRRTMVLVPQQPVMAEASVEHNLLLPFSFKACRDLPRPSREELARILEQVGLGDVGLDAQAERLSVGQAQRLAVVRAMLLGPRVLLLDEPLAPLDAQAAAALMRLIEQFVAAGNAAVMVSHQPPPAYNLHLVLDHGQVGKGD